MKLNKYDKALFYEIFVKKEYGILDTIISSSNTIFDIWWHIGLFSLYVLSVKFWFWVKLVVDKIVIDNFPNILWDFNIHFFEPVLEYLENAQILLKDFEKYMIYNNYWFSHILWDREMHFANISSQTSLYKNFLNKWGKIIKNCQFRQLNESIIENRVKKIDLVKIDIEWEEFEVLLGLDDKYFKIIQNLFFEYHILDISFQDKFDKLLNKLKKNHKSVVISESQYSSKIWYIFCSNQ